MSSADALADRRRQLMERMLRGEVGTTAPAAIPRRAPDAVVPLSPAQRQVWLHASLAPDAPIYNESITFHFRGAFDHAAMEQAINALVDRHESWRTSFAVRDGEPVQVIHPALVMPLPLDNVTELPPEARDAAAVAIATRDARRPFDLGRLPLIRVRAVRMAAEEHRLYLTLHHIVFDGVAIYNVILPELASLYAAFAKGDVSPLDAPRLGYGDYAVWAADQPAAERERTHWRHALAGLTGKLDLPADRPPAAHRTHAGAMEVFHLSAALTEGLKTLARSADATLYVTLLAGFTALLHRYTGAEDVVVGGVTDLRRRPELAPVVGYMLNTLPLRTRPAGMLSARDHLARTRETVLGALGASQLPFDEIVRAAGVRAAPGEHPLFDILFSVQPPIDRLPAGWDLTQMDVEVGGAKFDLYLELEERPEGIVARFLYSTERFDRATIRRLIDQWTVLLAGMVADPTQRLADLPLVPADAPPARLVGPTRAAPLDGLTLPEAVARQAQATPDAVAIRCGEARWSYATLDRTATQIARALRAQDLGRGALVGVVMERTPMLIAALLGVLRAGAAYLPLDPRQPVARLRQVAAQADLAGLLTERALVGLVPLDARPVVVADGREAPATEVSFAAPAGEDLAYVLYTSGSTGEPKGVELTHGALANLLAAMAEQPGFAASDRLLAVTTVSFDIAALELFLPLVRGGEVVLAPYETARDPAALAGLLAATQPTVMQATPATWGALVDAGWTGDPRLTVLCGGEALSRPLADQLLARAGAVWNLYGPTETCIWSTAAHVEAGDGPVPIGRPIANTIVEIVDGEGRAVPPGVPGELLIGGAGLAHGYRGRPDLTAERFVTGADGARRYRTGDRARDDGQGRLLHLCRVDAEEKIRGFRVAVEEVEGTLASHPAVAAAAVRGWVDASGSRALAAYVVPGSDALPPPSELATFLAKRLPDYMVPSSYTTLDALPMTASGKVARQALPAPVAPNREAEARPPETDAERRLAAIWSEVLGVETIARDDNFFDLGGHSLLAARLLARVSAAWDRKIGMPALLRARRLHEMAALLEAPEDDRPTHIVIQPRGWRPPFLWVEPGPSFVALAERIGRDQPLLGVPLEPEGNNASGPRSLEDHARDLVAAIRRIQPNGPYYLGAWCNAGILTYAAAVQMEAEGDDIRLLVLGDAFNPARPPVTDRRLSFRLRYHLRQLFGGGAGGRAAYLRERRDRLAVRLGLRAAPPHWSRDEARAELDRSVPLYRPGRFGGRTLLFQSQDPFTAARMDEEWATELSGRVQYRRFAGGHDTLLYEPHLGAVAALLRDALIDAQGEGALAGR